MPKHKTILIAIIENTMRKYYEYHLGSFGKPSKHLGYFFWHSTLQCQNIRLEMLRNIHHFKVEITGLYQKIQGLHDNST
jgi:hypothetical protein